MMLLTAPVSGYFLAKVNLHLFVDRRDVPPAGTDRDWAVYTKGGSSGDS